MRIMIVEDDPLIAFDLQMMIETVGHQVDVCDTLCAARFHLDDHLDDHAVDFALLDVDLPDGKSFSLASTLSAQRIPFVFVSASSRRDLPAHLVDVPFIAKPYDQAAILASIRCA